CGEQYCLDDQDCPVCAVKLGQIWREERRTAMKMRHAAAIAALGTVISSGPVWAVPPASIVGTWNGFSNQSAVQLVITSQGTGICRAVVGTMTGSTVSGFYCPRTGRVSLLRKIPATNDTAQTYTGNVGDDAATDRM